MTPAELDAMLDEFQCPCCRQFFRDCECDPLHEIADRTRPKTSSHGA